MTAARVFVGIFLFIATMGIGTVLTSICHRFCQYDIDISDREQEKALHQYMIDKQLKQQKEQN